MARLSDSLVAARLAPPETVRAAIARQAVYGGALDTALLEMEALDEGTLWDALGRATGLPIPAAALYETPERYQGPPGAPVTLDEAWSERCRAVPAGMSGGALAVLCGEPVAREGIDAAAAALGIPFKLYVVPEMRLAAVRQAIYGRPMPSRLVRLFARVAGTQPVRRWQASHAKPIRIRTNPGIEILPPAARPASVPAPAAAAPAAATATARAAAGPVRAPARRAPVPAKVDKKEVEALIARLKGNEPDAAAALASLVALTKQDHGPKPRRWEMWWAKHQDDDRVEWLFEGLSHKTPEIRASAEEELRALTGEYFGYHFDLPKREREDARARWQSWWYESGRARRSPSEP